MKTSPLENLWSTSHIPTPHFISRVSSFYLLPYSERTNQATKYDARKCFICRSFHICATKIVLFFSSSNISILRLLWIKGQSAFFVWCRTTSHNVTTQHQRSRAEHNIDMHWPCPCHILQYFYICNLFTCPFVYHLNRYHLCCCLLPFNATIFYWNTLYFIFFRILYEVAVI